MISRFLGFIFSRISEKTDNDRNIKGGIIKNGLIGKCSYQSSSGQRLGDYLVLTYLARACYNTPDET